MRKVFLIVGAAALAASMPAAAEKGGKGGGNGGGKGGAHAQHQGGGGGGKPAKAERGGGGGGQKAQRQAFQSGGKPQKAERQVFRGGGKPQKVERQAYRGGGKPAKAERQAFRAPKQERKLIREARRDYARPIETRRADYDDRRSYRDAGVRYSALSASCPPGLAKKGNGCLPPGQAKKQYGLGERVERTWFSGYQVPQRYSGFYSDSSDYYHRYDDQGYIYRVDSRTDMISGLIPLLGGGFAVGQAMPAGYDVYNLPSQYRDDYYDTDESLYRYGDDAIYEVDPQTGIIESIVALLGGGLDVGQALPSGYDAYNLPMDYRDEYQDTDEEMYRYADGNIYEVDTKTQIIQAIVEQLV